MFELLRFLIMQWQLGKVDMNYNEINYLNCVNASAQLDSNVGKYAFTKKLVQINTIKSLTHPYF